MAHGDTEGLAAAMWGPGWGRDPWHLWPRLPQPHVAARVSVSFPSPSPGCPGPQDQLREVTRQETTPRQVFTGTYSLQGLCWARPGRERGRGGSTRKPCYVAHHRAVRGMHRPM